MRHDPRRTSLDLYPIQRTITTLFSDTDRSLGGFVGFIERYYDLYKTVLDFYSLQMIGNVYCLHIASPTQSYGTVGMNFYISFLFGHWLV